MPAIYLASKFHASIVLEADDDFLFQQWTDAQLVKEREQYGHPARGICLHMVNPDDEVEVFPIDITEKTMYEGDFDAVRNQREFSFSLNGKAKVSVHKLTKEKIDAGWVPRVAGLLVNGHTYPVDLPIDLIIQSKRL